MKLRKYGLKTRDGQWFKTLGEADNHSVILAFETMGEAEEYRQDHELRGLTVEEIK